MRSFLIRCYPARWRARYGDEFEAILEERPLGPFDVADILLGALDAQLRLRGRMSDIQQGKGFSMSLRIGGFAAILGGAVFAMSIVLAIGVVSLIVLTSSDAIHANAVSYNVAEAGLGIGSLFFCALLFRTGLVPRFLAGWGFIGYACFAVGNLLGLFGVARAGLVGAIPGGLFELTFAVWLIARGFASTATVPSRARTAVAPA